MKKLGIAPAAKRRKCAATTRTAILDAARARFASSGYEHTGLRDIAADAGVDASLICRYFGSKQELLVEILKEQPDCADIFAGPAGHIGRGLAERCLLEKAGGDSDAAPTDLLIILRAASSSEAAPILRKAIVEKFTTPLQGRLQGEARRERAMLAASFMLGSMVMHALLKVNGSGTSNSDRKLAKRLANALQAVVDSKD